MRRRPRKSALGAAAALLAAVAFVTAASAHFSREERRLTVSSHGLFEKARLGTFCEAHGNHGVCADAGYPLETRGRLPVHPRGHVGLRTSAPAERVSVSFVRVREDGHFRFVGPTKRARMHDATGRRWRLRLPRDLPRRANVLDAFIRYPDGDGDLWAGIRVHGRHR